MLLLMQNLKHKVIVVPKVPQQIKIRLVKRLQKAQVFQQVQVPANPKV
jgi:hypothetical protein